MPGTINLVKSLWLDSPEALVGKILLCSTVFVEIDKLDWAHPTIFWIVMFVSIDLCCSKLCSDKLSPAVDSSYYTDL